MRDFLFKKFSFIFFRFLPSWLDSAEQNLIKVEAHVRENRRPAVLLIPERQKRRFCLVQRLAEGKGIIFVSGMESRCSVGMIIGMGIGALHVMPIPGRRNHEYRYMI